LRIGYDRTRDPILVLELFGTPTKYYYIILQYMTVYALLHTICGPTQPKM